MNKLAFVLAAALGTLAAGPSFSHAKLQSSSPAANAQLSEAPKALTLKFNEAAQIAVLKLVVNGKELPIAIDKAATPAAEITIALPALAPGDYQVQWTALAADDGHVTKGAFSFSIAVSK